MNDKKRIAALLLVVFICFDFCSCRVRTTKVDSESVSQSVTDHGADSVSDKNEAEEPADNKNKSEKKQTDKTETNKKPVKKTTADSNIKKQSDSAVRQHTQKKKAKPKVNNSPKGDSANGKDNPSDKSTGNINTSGDDTSNRNDLDKPDTEIPQTPMQVAMEKYDELVSVNNSEIYECQKQRVYFELEENYQSVTRDTFYHSIITDAGGYNIAEIKYSAIDSEWINNNSPDIIIKVVNNDILSGDVIDDAKAQNTAYSLSQREGCNKILLLSAQLFESEAGKKTAKLFMAKAMYPAIYEELDVSLAYSEMSGEEQNGIYAYFLSL